ncbi:MAG: glutamine--fructose-6-phosphate transaminase (isomerizing) [Saprospiraceae bacterium]|nr:glutamine--fructose-6-phosphate transaminase (isomerizing) [Saprospiraceae bacterium]
MCGIVAYIGGDAAFPVLIKGLQRLEYRGYDSAGIALLDPLLSVYKKQGKVAGLLEFARDVPTAGKVGIGHTRWATHGVPSDVNAHPHVSSDGEIALVHNGIIENYSLLKTALENQGHRFVSETDTEVLVHLIAEIKSRESADLEEAVRLALQRVVGAYAIVVMDAARPDILIGARKSSPLVLGIGADALYLASDATPIVEYTNKVVYLQDEELVVLRSDGTFEIKTMQNELMPPFIQELDINIEMLEKGGFEHFMLKEIHDQPRTIAECMRGRIHAAEGWVHLGGMEVCSDAFMNAQRLIFAACGTSWHAGLIAEYLFEDLARIPVEVEYASEFRYRNPVIAEQDVVIAISQSGETADTLAALELAKARGATTYGVVNVVGSSIARVTDAGSYIHAGPEIGVASTKAFTAQVTLLTLMALQMGLKKGTLDPVFFRELLYELEAIPGKVQAVLAMDKLIQQIAVEIKDKPNALYLGRGYNFPVALEGALKLKEISYIHAEGYPAAEMKHGPIALIDEEMPVIVLATNKSAYEKIASNIQEVKARKGLVIAIVSRGDTQIRAMADYTLEIPDTLEPLTPLLAAIPLQLLAYHIAVMRGCDVDQPRNLAKSVTVE